MWTRLVMDNLFDIQYEHLKQQLKEIKKLQASSNNAIVTVAKSLINIKKKSKMVSELQDQIELRMQSVSFLHSLLILTSVLVLVHRFLTSLQWWLKFKLKYNLLTVCDGILVFYYMKFNEIHYSKAEVLNRGAYANF